MRNTLETRARQMTRREEPIRGKLLANMKQDTGCGTEHWSGCFAAPIRHPPAHAATKRPYLRTHSRRLRTTTRFECGYRESAPTTRVQSEPHHTARTCLLKVSSLPALPASIYPKTKAPWREEVRSSTSFRQIGEGHLAFWAKWSAHSSDSAGGTTVRSPRTMRASGSFDQ